MNSSEPPATPGSPAPSIDVEQLAEKVYRLMLAELRMELARQGGTGRRR
jgi:hypothetical protein